MVFPDISSLSLPPKKSANDYYIPTVGDRFLAFVIDAFLFGPVVSLFVAKQLRDVKSYTFQEEGSPEAMVVQLLFFVTIVLISIFIQSVFTYFWSGTPGQRLLNMRVISLSYNSQIRRFTTLTFPQAVLRSILWWVSLGFMGWPFLEILSHPQRRTFHDRAADTMVVSMVPTGDPGPSPVEQKFIASWFRLGFLSCFFLFSLYIIKAHQLVKAGFFSRQEMASKGLQCDVYTPDNYSLNQRLDVLMSVKLLENEKDDDWDCLVNESELALWNREANDKPMGYLVKLLFAKEKEDRKEYKNYICERFPNHGACEISQWFLEGQKNAKEFITDKKLFISRIILLKEAMESNEFVAATALFSNLMKESTLEPYLERHYIRTVWQVQEVLNKNRRVPAGQELNHFVQEFKKRFEVP